MISYRKIASNTGGSSGVNYCLYAYNKKHKIFDNLINVFEDCYCISDSIIPFDEITGNCSANNAYTRKKAIKGMLNKLPIVPALMYLRQIYKAKRWMDKVSQTLAFSKNDYFVLHDMEAAISFCYLKNRIPFSVVYHQQGSLYSEWKSLNGGHSLLLKLFMEHVQRRVFSSADRIGFPSEGAKSTLSEMLKDQTEVHLINEKKSILYNGFDAVYGTEHTEFADRILARVPDNCIVFITVASLSHHKGVDRIPDFLAYLNERDIDFKWILIGDGVESDRISKKIQEKKIEANTIWEKRIIPHNDILKLFQHSHFYVLFHRVSIFDFSIIEAMSYGVVPVLSEIGGNKEMVQDGENGFLFHRRADYKKFLGGIDKQTYNALRRNCVEYQKKFDALTFLQRYADFVGYNME